MRGMEVMEVVQQEYVAQMDEINRRVASIKTIAEISFGQLSMAVVTECVYLQFRKVLELIAMSSLVANSQAMQQINRGRRKLGNMWNGDTILKLVERINPDFYPIPMIERQPRHSVAKAELVEKTESFLTRSDFSRLYNLCGGLMHADNPLGGKMDYKKYCDEGPKWESRILELLGCHKIRLVGQDGFYLVHMREQRDGKPHLYKFERLVGQPPAGTPRTRPATESSSSPTPRRR